MAEAVNISINNIKICVILKHMIKTYDETKIN